MRRPRQASLFLARDPQLLGGQLAEADLSRRGNGPAKDQWSTVRCALQDEGMAIGAGPLYKLRRRPFIFSSSL